MTTKIVSKTVNLVSWKVDTASYQKVVKKIKSIKKLTEDCGKSFSKMVGGNGVNQWAKTVENVQKKQAALAQKQAAGARQTAEQMRKAEISQRRMAEYEKRVAQQRARVANTGMVGKSAGHNAALYAAQNEQMRRGHAALGPQPKNKSWDNNPDNARRSRFVMTGYEAASNDEKAQAKAAHSARMRRARMYNSIDNLESQFGRGGRFSSLGESAQRAAYNRLQKLADASYKSEDGLSDFNRVLRQTTQQLARMNTMAKAKGGKGYYSENGIRQSRAQARRTALLANGGGRKSMAGRAGLGGMGLGVLARGLLPAMSVGMAVSGAQSVLTAGINKTREDRKLKTYNADPLKFMAYQQAVGKKNGFNLSADKFSDMSKDVLDAGGNLSHGEMKWNKKKGEYNFSGGGQFGDIVNMVMSKTKGSAEDKKAAGEQVLANLKKLENAQDFAAYIDKLGKACNMTKAEMTQLAETVNDGSWLLGVSTSDIDNTFAQLKAAGYQLTEQERQNIAQLEVLGASVSNAGLTLAQFAASSFFEGLGLSVDDVNRAFGELKEPVKTIFYAFGKVLNILSPLTDVIKSWWTVGENLFGVINNLLAPFGGLGTMLDRTVQAMSDAISFIPNTINKLLNGLKDMPVIGQYFKDVKAMEVPKVELPKADQAQHIINSAPQASMQTSAQQRSIVNPIQVRMDQQTKVTIQPDGNGISNCFKGIAETVCKENHDRMIELITGPTLESTTA
ncbi:hypothetical protein QWR64_003996 [Escherichia coli]|nr:hypothetical protein [Escherichia coli]